MFSRLAPKPFSKFFFLLLFVVQGNLYAQLNADFSIDKTGGCSPLSVQFTNKTIGTTPTTTYQWSLGNGNTSTLHNPGATYSVAKTYTVTLIAKDGNITSTKSAEVIVYKNPVVDFSAGNVSGCVPLNVSFAANATPGDGNIDKYIWDFGDGATKEETNATTSHQYMVAQKPPVNLTVTNSFGCYTNLSKSNIINAVKGITAGFQASALELCTVGQEIQFKNTSVGGGTLSYEWDFGDGTNDVSVSPKHVFDKAGSFQVNLKVTNSAGCSEMATPVTINVANFKADFEVPPLLCSQEMNVFKNLSTPGASNIEWWIDDNPLGAPDDKGDYYSQFYDAGSFDLKLVAHYGNCSVSAVKKITINPKPLLYSFDYAVQGACGAPVTIQFTDNLSTSAKWKWSLPNSEIVFGTTKTASFTFTGGVAEKVRLEVTTKEGCSDAFEQYVNYYPPNIQISDTKYNQQNESCKGVDHTFFANGDSLIETFAWDFGDGTKSTERSPSHHYDKAGTYTVNLDYVTKAGCKGSTVSHPQIVIEKPFIDFAVEGSTTICGNTPTIFRSAQASGHWYIDGVLQRYDQSPYVRSSFTYKFQRDTTYTIMLVVPLGVNCLDTIVKKDYVKVLPAFPNIEKVINTCTDDRTTVKFTDTSYKALKWNWDFGDGTNITYTSKRDTAVHKFPANGVYKTVLTATNGACSVKDSVNVFITKPQHPKLTLNTTEACAFALSKPVGWEAKGITPDAWYNWIDPNGGIWDGFENMRLQYGDLSFGRTDIGFGSYIGGEISYLSPGQDSIRIIYTSAKDGCEDTTNFARLHTSGPTAAFARQPGSGCFYDPVVFNDLSKSKESQIVEWFWSFREDIHISKTTGGTFTFSAPEPGEYFAHLRVKDADGCESYLDSVDVFELSGPKADFDASGFTVAPNTMVNFTNTSNYYNALSGNSLQWFFPDGSLIKNEEETKYLFGGEGEYTVKMIASNTNTGCSDTVLKKITVRKVNSAFTYSIRFVNSNSCPPAIATFTSVSTNAARLAWDFGDGGVGDDQKVVAHTYQLPGLYRVVHYSYDEFDNVDSTEDFVEVKGPYAILKADKYFACNTLTVRLSAEVKYAKNFTWDFGDGTVIPGTDTLAVHDYLTAGIYEPALIMEDVDGCRASSQILQKIIVDSLSVSLSSIPASICNSGEVFFENAIHSFSQDAFGQMPVTGWKISTPAGEISNYNPGSGIVYDKPGSYPATISVQSDYGCSTTSQTKVIVKQGVTPVISGPRNVCRGDLMDFIGNASPFSSNLIWQWKVDGEINGAGNILQHVSFSKPGIHEISLLVNNGSCADSISLSVDVHDLPSTKIIANTDKICLGNTLSLQAVGADSYQWMQGSKDLGHLATLSISPTAPASYKLIGKDNIGCEASDSINLAIVYPFEVKVQSPVNTCAGESVQLTASGAAKYLWIDQGNLDNPAIPNPISKTPVSTNYRVVGYDEWGCFSDTATVKVIVNPLPSVNAGKDQQIIGGTSITLTPQASADVIQWRWQPAEYLSCSTCPRPSASPQSPVSYVLTVTNNAGCSATDTLSIELLCGKDLVYIPTGFTPNGDNLNDRFVIRGSGVKQVEHLAVFDRWGKKVFERKQFAINDPSSGWDGNFAGQPLPSGVYIYTLKVNCYGGEVFDYKGTITLIK